MWLLLRRRESCRWRLGNRRARGCENLDLFRHALSFHVVVIVDADARAFSWFSFQLGFRIEHKIPVCLIAAKGLEEDQLSGARRGYGASCLVTLGRRTDRSFGRSLGRGLVLRSDRAASQQGRGKNHEETTDGENEEGAPDVRYRWTTT